MKFFSIAALSLILGCAAIIRPLEPQQIQNCKVAREVLEEVDENDLLIAQSFTNARPAGQIVFYRYLEVNSQLRDEMKAWRKRNCRDGV